MQRDELGVPQVVVSGPLQKLELSDRHRHFRLVEMMNRAVCEPAREFLARRGAQVLVFGKPIYEIDGAYSAANIGTRGFDCQKRYTVELGGCLTARTTTLQASNSESDRPESSSSFTWLRGMVGVDPRALACFRIALGADLIYEIAGRTVSLTAYFSDAGVLPRDSVSPPWRIVPSLFFLSGDVGVQALFCLVAAVAALMLIAGYRTTLVTIASWVLYLGMVDRNPFINSGGDHLLRYLLFWSMFVPLGAVASIDERLKRRAGAVTSRDSRAPIATCGVAGLKAQILSVYLFAGLYKLQSPAWQSGVAVARELQMYTRSTPFGLWMLAFPNALAVATHVVPWVQIIGAVLLLVPFRSGLPITLIVSGFTLFQLLLALMVVLGNFQQVGILMMIPLLPPWFWDRWTGATAASQFLSKSISREPSTKSARAVRAVAGAIAVYVFAMNAGHCVAEQILPGHATLPGRPERIGSLLGLDQTWRLFMLPEIDRPFGWLVARGTLIDGARIDLLSNRSESEWSIPPPFSPVRFFDWRGRFYRNSLMRLSSDDARMKAYVRYVCSDWNSHHRESRRLRALDISLMVDVLHPDGELRGVRPSRPWSESEFDSSCAPLINRARGRP